MKRYIIINTNEITDDLIKLSTSVSEGSIRKSIDQSKSVIEFLPRVPSSLVNAYTVINHEQMLYEIRKPEWQGSQEE